VFTMAVARSSYGGVAIRYMLPVLWMTQGNGATHCPPPEPLHEGARLDLAPYDLSADLASSSVM